MARQSASSRRRPGSAAARKASKKAPARKKAAKKVAKKAPARKKAAKKTAKKAPARKKAAKKTAKTAPARKKAAKKTAKTAPARKKVTKKVAKKAAKKAVKKVAKKAPARTKAAKPAPAPKPTPAPKPAPAPAAPKAAPKPPKRRSAKPADFPTLGAAASSNPGPVIEPGKRGRSSVHRDGGQEVSLYHRPPTEKETTARRQQLVELLRRMLGSVEELSQSALSEATAALTGEMEESSTVRYSQDITLQLMESENIEVKHVVRALAKIDGESDQPYGRCESCGIWISTARLMAKPHARICIHCHEKFEREGGGEEFGVRPEIRF